MHCVQIPDSNLLPSKLEEIDLAKQNFESFEKGNAVFRSNFSRRFALFIAVNILAFGPVSAAPEPPETPDTPERFSVLVTFGDDECPAPDSKDEIVVCAQKPESERYRIPKELRKTEDELAVDHSWSSTVALHEDAARAGRPNSCSVNGTNGFTGCQSALLRQWFDERREIDD